MRGTSDVEIPNEKPNDRDRLSTTFPFVVELRLRHTWPLGRRLLCPFGPWLACRVFCIIVATPRTLLFFAFILALVATLRTIVAVFVLFRGTQGSRVSELWRPVGLRFWPGEEPRTLEHRLPRGGRGLRRFAVPPQGIFWTPVPEMANSPRIMHFRPCRLLERTFPLGI